MLVFVPKCEFLFLRVYVFIFVCMHERERDRESVHRSLREGWGMVMGEKQTLNDLNVPAR